MWGAMMIEMEKEGMILFAHVLSSSLMTGRIENWILFLVPIISWEVIILGS